MLNQNKIIHSILTLFYLINLVLTDVTVMTDTVMTDTDTAVTDTAAVTADASSFLKLVNDAKEFMKNGKIKNALNVYNKIIGKYLVCMCCVCVLLV